MDGNIQTIIGRGGASLVASKAGDKLFLIGGFAGKEMDDVYIYDLNKKVWKFLTQTKVPTPRSVCISTGITVSACLIISLDRQKTNYKTLRLLIFSISLIKYTLCESP